MKDLNFGKEMLLKKGTKRVICYSTELFMIYCLPETLTS